MTNCVRCHAYLLLCLFAIPFFRFFVVESLGKPYDIRVSTVLTPGFLGESSITSDNGSEFSSLPQALPNTPIYYAHPYSSYERRLNEKQNSLIRCFFPKGRSLDGNSPDAVQRVQDWSNRFPRKSFSYASAAELFQTVLFDIAI